MRFLSTLIDLIIFSIICILISFGCINKKIFPEIGQVYQINDNIFYYFWILSSITLIIVQYILIPLVNRGKTLGMMILGLDIKYKNSNWTKSFIKKVQLGPVLWIILFIMFMIFVNPTIINKMVLFSTIKAKESLYEGNKIVEDLLKENKWTTLETVFYSIPSTLSPLLLIVNLFDLISIGFKNKKISIIDRICEREVVYKNKFITKSKINYEYVEPIKEEKYNINWR